MKILYKYYFPGLIELNKRDGNACLRVNMSKETSYRNDDVETANGVNCFNKTTEKFS
jgi:hypothetical protein